MAWAAGAAVLAGSGWLAAGPAAAESKGQQDRTASGYVAEALQAELAGKNSRRDGLLRAALEEAPDHPAARSQSGYVRSAGRWVKFDEPSPSASADHRLAAYRRMRDKYGDTVAEQLELARWCKRARLLEQYRAHLGHVLEMDPDQPEARAGLDYQWVNGGWMTTADIERAKSRAAAADAALRQWRPKLLEIRDGLLARNPKRRQKAEEKLLAIEDSAAIGAIEAVLCEKEASAPAGIEKLADMPAAEASVSLARQALFSPWPAVRQAAVAKLKTRDRETFVPVLLALMGSPIQSRIELYEDPGTGQLLYRHIFYRQGQDRDLLAVADSAYGWNASNNLNVSYAYQDNRRPEFRRQSLVFDDGTRAAILPGGTIQPVGRRSAWGDWMMQGVAQVRDAAARSAVRSDYDSVVSPLMQAAAWADQWGAALAPLQERLDAAAKAQKREATVARQNTATLALNRAVCRLLGETTGVNLPDTPDAWSEWWADTNEVYVPGYKPTSVTYQGSGEIITTQTQGQAQVRAWAPRAPIAVWGMAATAHYSCLAAGTPVWTDSGTAAVETIRVGDRVLSQDPDSGQLAYKPVLHITVRQEAPLVKLELLDDTITTSSGHPFWIAGQGWLKARDIGPYMHFHGAAGTTPLVASQPAGTGRVYNLIVADFHSYFVGKAAVLSHDITRRRPSEMLVPGLKRD
jgi:hypothetical protein